MANMVDDLPAEELAFNFIAGRLCLDLAATVGERWRRCFERLRSPDDLGRWLVRARLVETAPTVGHDDLEAARELRGSIYRAARLAGGSPPDPFDVAEINRRAARPPFAPRLDETGRRVSWASHEPVTAALSTVARDAVDLLSGPLADRVRECAAPDCALLFVDASRPGRRRWCSMDGCGNRAKTVAYRRRRAR